jgi:hypothetical protein
MGLALLMSPAARAGEVLFADVVWEAAERQQHPAEIERTIIIREDTVGPVEICLGYINNLDDGGRGSVSALVEISRGEDGSEAIETVNLSGKVRKNGAGKCKTVEALGIGDSVTFPFVMSDFARMDEGDVAIVAGAVAIDGGDAGKRSACSGGASAEDPGTALLADTVFQAAKKQKHPKQTERVVVVREDTEGPVEACVGYLNDLDEANKGKFSAKIEVARAEDNGEVTVETVRFGKKVRKNKANRCETIDGLKTGDSATFIVDLKGFPRMKKEQIATVVSGLTIGGGDPFRNTSCSGGSVGALSAADQSAIVKLASWSGGSRGSQLRLQTGNRHYVDVRLPGGKISAFGPKNSIAEVVDLACKSIGCGSGGQLSGADQEAVAKLQRSIRGSVKRLGLRFEGASRVHVDWQGPPEGIHTGPFGSITTAVNNFCSHPQGGCV